MSQNQAETYGCPTCKRDVTLTEERKLSFHLHTPGKPAKGACPSSLLRVAFVSGGRVR